MKSPKNKPMDDESAKEKFIASAQFEVDLHSYMDGQGYKWGRSERMWVDDGSLEREWADRINDERRDRELLK